MPSKESSRTFSGSPSSLTEPPAIRSTMMAMAPSPVTFVAVPKESRAM